MVNIKNKKILIVDDEEGIRESLKLILADYYNLILTDKGEEAAQLIEHDPTIALVLLGSKMSKTGGLDVLKTIKAKAPKINIVVLTSHRLVGATSEATRLGASDYIVKPFKSEEILNTVKRNLN